MKGAPRAYVYRSHSGHYGIVNFESGYRNLERFFFGDVRTSVALDNPQIDLPKNDKGFTATYNIENIVSIRGLPTPLNKRTKDTFSSTFRKDVYIRNQKVHLFTTFLWKGGRVRNGKNKSLGLSIHFRIVPEYHQDIKFWWDNHYEDQAVFDDRLIIVTEDKDGSFKAKWNWGSESLDVKNNLQLDRSGKKHVARISFNRSKPLKVSGDLLIEITPWNA